MEKTSVIDPLDYTLAIKNKGQPSKPWRWEIYLAGKTKAAASVRMFCDHVGSDPCRQSGLGEVPVQLRHVTKPSSQTVGIRAASKGLKRIYVLLTEQPDDSAPAPMMTGRRSSQLRSLGGGTTAGVLSFWMVEERA